MKLFGKDAKLTKIAQTIMDEDIDVLEEFFSKAKDINENIIITEHIEELPITLALAENRLNVLKWLLEKGANLNITGKPAIVVAASSCVTDVIELLIGAGADVNAIDHVGKSAAHSALYAAKFDVIRLLVSNGYNLKDDGVILRQAVNGRQFAAIDILLELGIDINLSKPDMVFPYNPTPVMVAAQNNDIATVKKLVQNGADVTIKDNYGFRPYTAALENRNLELQGYLKSLEPKSWHDEDKRVSDLESYELPKDLIRFLLDRHLRIEMADNQHVSFIEFSNLVNCREVTWNSYKFLDLLAEVEDYGAAGLLVWYPHKKCLASADYEHGEFKLLGSWEDFVKDPSHFMDLIFD